MLMLCSYYSTESPLPDDDAAICRVCRAESDQEKILALKVADEFFPVRNGKRRNARADREIAKAKPRIRAARENGSRGGRPPSPKPSGNPVGYEPSGLSHGNPVANPLETHAGVGVGVGVGAKALHQEKIHLHRESNQ